MGLYWRGTYRQYLYSRTVRVSREGLEHECEANAGNFPPRGQANMRKLPLSLPILRKIFNVVKLRRAYILERLLFQTTKGRSARYYWEKRDPNQILMGRVLGERVYNLINAKVFSNSPKPFYCNFQCPLNILMNTFYSNRRDYRKLAIKLTVMLSHLVAVEIF